MSKEPAEYLKHIRDEINYLLSLTEKDLTREQSQTLISFPTLSL